MDVNADIARVLDANFNRAREAVRVLEEYARLVLNDAGVAEQAKRLRHDLASAFAEHGLAEVVRARDIAGDVGTELETDAEYRRASSAEVVLAAGKRLGEALRVLEEYGKTHSEPLARSIERLRYEGYELERRLAVRLHARQRFGGVRLYVIVTES
ncbi:MAG: thiamine phosphate synthase, partial [Phycisphaerae bacterium]